MSKEIRFVIKLNIIISILTFFYGLIIGKSEVYIGMFLGCVVSLLAFFILMKDAKIALELNEKQAYKFTIKSYMKRYFLYLLTLVLMFKIGFNYFLASSLGLLSIKFCILILWLINFFKNIKKKFTERR